MKLLWAEPYRNVLVNFLDNGDAQFVNGGGLGDANYFEYYDM